MRGENVHKHSHEGELAEIQTLGLTEARLCEQITLTETYGNPMKIIQFPKNFIATIAILTATNFGAMAASIQLYNTGVNGVGGLLGNAAVDSHYSVVAAPGPYTTAYTGNGGVLPTGWIADGPASRWIGVTSFMGEWRPTGTYTFRTTFNLTGLNPSSASISLNIASDNNCDVFLNGVHTGITTPFAGFSSFSAYNINSGFLPGINTLDFSVYEPGSTPSGLRVQISGNANVVPEPTAIALIGMGAMMLVGFRRK